MFSLLLSLSCGSSPVPADVPNPPSLPVTPEDCARYPMSSSTHGFCRIQIAQQSHGAFDAGTLCEPAGVLEGDCRYAWVSARLGGNAFSRDALLASCAGNPDCGFVVLESRRRATLTEQIEDCYRYTGDYAENCGSHMVDVWWMEGPEEEYLVEVYAMDGYEPVAGRAMGMMVACRELGSCKGTALAVKTCEENVAELTKHPWICEDALKRWGNPRRGHEPQPPPQGNP